MHAAAVLAVVHVARAVRRRRAGVHRDHQLGDGQVMRVLLRVGAVEARVLGQRRRGAFHWDLLGPHGEFQVAQVVGGIHIGNFSGAVVCLWNGGGGGRVSAAAGGGAVAAAAAAVAAAALGTWFVW